MEDQWPDKFIRSRALSPEEIYHRISSSFFSIETKITFGVARVHIEIALFTGTWQPIKQTQTWQMPQRSQRERKSKLIRVALTTIIAWEGTKKGTNATLRSRKDPMLLSSREDPCGFLGFDFCDLSDGLMASNWTGWKEIISRSQSCLANALICQGQINKAKRFVCFPKTGSWPFSCFRNRLKS